jgi:UTP:GlnB (protein PII) uridylyltransferase
VAAAQVTIDNCTASNYSVVNVVCRDRKGLVYDLMRTLKDIHVRVAYAKIVVRGDLAETDLFVEEADGQRVKERWALAQYCISLLP